MYSHVIVYYDDVIYSVLQDPKLYVQTILNVHKKYNVLVVTAFRSDAGFVAALDKVFIISLGAR